MGDSYTVRIKQNNLICTTNGLHYGPITNEVAVSLVNNKEWNEMIQYLHTRKWKERYDLEACDGTHWHLLFRDGKKRIRSYGSNAYPPGFKKIVGLLNNVFDAAGKPVNIY